MGRFDQDQAASEGDVVVGGPPAVQADALKAAASKARSDVSGGSDRGIDEFLSWA